MARPIKQGLDYFPLDVDFFNDDKIQLIEAEFGIKGTYIAIRLLTKIYFEGYYYEWSADKCLLLTKNIGAESVSNGLVNEVVNGLIRRGIFSNSVFNQFNILTSTGIQKRFLNAISRRTIIPIIKEIWLIPIPKNINVNIYSINDDINSINVGNSTQSKVKESKEKESKESVIGKHTIGNSDFEDVEILEPEEKTDNFSEKLSIFQKEFSQSKRFEEIGMVFSKSKNQLENLLQEFIQENIKSRRLDKYINQQALFDELKKYFYSWVNCRENKEQDKPKSENAKRADRCLERMSYGKS